MTSPLPPHDDSRTVTPRLDEGSSLRQALDAFEEAWQGAGPTGAAPALEDFLPPGVGDRRQLLLELIAVDLEYRWRTPPAHSDALGPRPRLEAYLARYPELGPPEEAPPALVAEEYRARHLWGDRPAHAEYAARFPRQAGELDGLLERADRELTDEQLSRTSYRGRNYTPPAPSQRSARPASSEWPEVAGYEILGVLGEGGMGVVYRARQFRPQRLVALKMLRPGGPAAAGDLARFRREAEAAARLQHPNVVSIYEVGEQDGRPFFSMEYVGGGSLAQQLAGQPQPPAEAAQLVETLARAVHHAHERGVIHRDLNPANVLLSFSGRSADKVSLRDGGAGPTPLSERPLNDWVPKITDFGLAKQVGDGGHTATGAVLGTPSYMAPEQAQGKKEVGPAADVYALGAILYECLTGRAPFRGVTVLETLEQVRRQEPVPPRRLNPRVPRDLETVCLKCLEKDPHRRYASADDLGGDLSRFLQGRPVRARPAGALERLRKWARRRPALATLVGVLALALIGAVVYERRLARALAQTAAQRERADGNYREARAALQRILEQTRDRRRADLPRLRELRRAQQEEALAFFVKVADQPGTTPEVRRDVAEACTEAGRLAMDLGSRDDARQYLDRARGLWEGLVEHFPAESRYQAGQATCLDLLGAWHKSGEEALGCFRAALELRQALADQDPSAESRLALAVTNHGLAAALFKGPWDGPHLRNRDEMETCFLRAEALCEDLARAQPDRHEYRAKLAQIRASLSLVYQNSNRPEPTERYHDQAEADFQRLLHDDPGDWNTLLRLAQLRVNWSYVLAVQGRRKEALDSLEESAARLEEMLRQEPSYDPVRNALYNTRGRQYEFLDDAKRYSEALAVCRRTVELAPDEQGRRYRRLFLAMALARAGRHAEAVAQAESLITPQPIVPPQDLFTYLARVCAIAAVAARADGRLPPKEREALAERDAVQAVTFLARAKEAGGPAKWPEVKKEVLAEPDFAPLRSRDDFRRLLGP
jgi:serine/threonine protein kinase/tetratricopeptide (TPR) repeat protein